MPENRDSLIVVEVNCKTVNEEHHKLQNSQKIKEFLLPRSQFLQNISKIVGQKIETLDEVDVFYDALLVEADQHDYWWPIWSKKEQREIMEQLKVMADFNYETNWSIPIIQKLRSGLLIEEIYKNIKNYIDGNSQIRFYHYSAHDTTVASMLSLLGSFDNKLIPYGSTIIFELHKTDDYFVKIYYLNDTYKELPNLLKIGICDLQEQCPLNKFQQRIKTFYVRNYDEECRNDSSSQFIHSKSLVLLSFCVILYLMNV